jgi:WD40 repeat protein
MEVSTRLSSDNPYPGPRPFEEKEQDLFFGRDREVRELLSLIAAHRAVLLYAQSGAGKTSLLNARIIPLLKEGKFEVVLPVARVRGPRAEEIGLEEIPNIYVLNTLTGWSGDSADTASLAPVSLAAFLGEREHLTDEDELPLPRVVIFDQFEELFTFYPERWEERQDFFLQMAEALKDDPLLRVLFVIREDYLAQLEPYTKHLPERLRTRYRLERLRKEAACMAVEGPLRGTGRSFDTGAAENLVQELLNIQVESAPGETIQVVGEYVEPVQLQVVCQNLWLNLPPDVNVITSDHLQEFGDVEEALKGFYETAIGMAAEEPGVKKDDLRRWFTNELITPAGTRGIVFRDVERTGEIPNSAVDVLEKQHIIRAEVRGGERWYELTHDRLIEPVRKANESWLEEEQRRQVEEERRRADEQTRIARRFLGFTIALVVVALMAIVATVFAFHQARVARERQIEAEGAKAEAEKQSRIALSRQLAAQSLFRLDDQLDLALLLGVEACRIDRTVESRGSLLAGLRHNPHLDAFLRGHKDPVSSVCFSPDGKLLASGSSDSTIILWDVATRQRVGEPLTGHKSWVYSVCFSPDGKLLASGSWDDTIILWDVATRQPVGEPLTGHKDDVYSVCFSPDGKLLASGSGGILTEGTIILWDVATGQRVGEPLTGHKDDVYSVCFSPDSKLLASGSVHSTIILWDVATGQRVGEPLTGHKSGVFSVCFSPDGKLLASGSGGNTIILWDVATGQRVGEPLTGHKDDVRSVCFSPDGKLLASGSWDDAIILWDVATRQRVGEPLTGHKYDVSSVCFSPDGKLLASGSGGIGTGGTIILWDVATGQRVGEPLTGHKDDVRSVCFSPDSKLLASGSRDRTIILWDVATRQRVGEPLTGHKSYVSSVCFSPDGKLLASRSSDNTIILWDVATGQRAGEPLTGHTDSVLSVCFSPDGKLLASRSSDSTIILWDVSRGQRVGGPLTGHKYDVYSVCFSPDGKLLASGSGGILTEGTIILWDVATGQRVGEPLTGHKDDLLSVCFSPDSKLLASGSKDNTIILWDVATGQRVGEPLTGHKDDVYSVCFSPDGKLLASGSWDDAIILWDVDLESWKDRARRIANRNLTRAEWKQYLGDEPYRKTSPDLPVPDQAFGKGLSERYEE